MLLELWILGRSLMCASKLNLYAKQDMSSELHYTAIDQLMKIAYNLM